MQHQDSIVGVCFAKLGVIERQKNRTTRTNHTPKNTQKHMPIHGHWPGKAQPDSRGCMKNDKHGVV